VGKTTTLRWLLEQVPSPNKIYLDLERLDQRAVFAQANYDLALNYLVNRGLDAAQPMTVALDEIQYAPNLPSVVKYLIDHFGIKFILSGSSSYYLKHLFSESLAGRKVVYGDGILWKKCASTGSSMNACKGTMRSSSVMAGCQMWF
jgi:predicted AAA+ superfamily ATPase